VRTIDGKSCKDLAGAAAVALALLLSSEEPLSEGALAGTSSSNDSAAAQDTTGEQRPTPQDRATTKAPLAAAVPPAAPDAPSDEAGPERRWHVLLVAPVGAVALGPLRQTSRAWGLAAGFSVDRWRFYADGKLWAPQQDTVTNVGDDFAVSLKRVSAGAHACRSVVGSRLELSPCLMMSVHHLSVLGSGPNLVPRSDAATWAAVGVGAQARLLIAPWFGLVAGVEAEVQLSRPEVRFSLPVAGSSAPQASLVERLAPAAAAITLGSQWIF
jgi:hypothetical protein